MSPNILTERQKTHGDFAQVAETAQHLKTLWRSMPNWSLFSDIQRESLDMKATKLARIFCGDPNVVDHWLDDAGYAELVARDLSQSPVTAADDISTLTFTPTTPRPSLSEMMRRVDQEETP